jgi:hypothetical protein
MEIQLKLWWAKACSLTGYLKDPLEWRQWKGSKCLEISTVRCFLYSYLCILTMPCPKWHATLLQSVSFLSGALYFVEITHFILHHFIIIHVTHSSFFQIENGLTASKMIIVDLTEYQVNEEDN